MDFLGYAYMALGFVVFVVAVSLGASVIFGVQGGVSAQPTNASCIANPTLAACQTVASNATGYGLTGITNLANQSGNIGLILGAVIIIGLLLSAFMVSRK